jgi:hypothetical protein
MTILGRVVKWLRGRSVWAGNRYDPGDSPEHHNLPSTRAEGPVGRRPS